MQRLQVLVRTVLCLIMYFPLSFAAQRVVVCEEAYEET